MADIISGLTIVSGVSRFIPALLVLFVVYGLLSLTKAIGDNKFIHALIAFCIAAIFLVSEGATKVVSFMAPWFVILFIFIIFILIAFKTMGVSDASILKVMGEYRSIVFWIISLAAVIAVLALANVYGQGLLNVQPGYEDYVQNSDGTYTTPEGEIVAQPPGVASPSFSTNLTRTIFHPQILGFMLIGLIGVFSVYMMTRMPRV